MGNEQTCGNVLTPLERVVYKENNLFQKQLFRKYLIDAILHDNKEDFSKIVEAIGIQWGVRRTVSNKIQHENEIKESESTESTNEIKSVIHKGFNEFTEYLWNNKDVILSGKYNNWNKSEFEAYSYESKICFLLNPKHYKVIYDSHNRKAVKEILNSKKRRR